MCILQVLTDEKNMVQTFHEHNALQSNHKASLHTSPTTTCHEPCASVCDIFQPAIYYPPFSTHESSTLHSKPSPVQMSISYTKLALTSPKWALMTIALCQHFRWHFFHSGSYQNDLFTRLSVPVPAKREPCLIADCPLTPATQPLVHCTLEQNAISTYYHVLYNV